MLFVFRDEEGVETFLYDDDRAKVLVDFRDEEGVAVLFVFRDEEGVETFLYDDDRAKVLVDFRDDEGVAMLFVFRDEEGEDGGTASFRDDERLVALFSGNGGEDGGMVFVEGVVASCFFERLRVVIDRAGVLLGLDGIVVMCERASACERVRNAFRAVERKKDR